MEQPAGEKSTRNPRIKWECTFMNKDVTDQEEVHSATEKL